MWVQQFRKRSPRENGGKFSFNLRPGVALVGWVLIGAAQKGRIPHQPQANCCQPCALEATGTGRHFPASAGSPGVSTFGQLCEVAVILAFSEEGNQAQKIATRRKCKLSGYSIKCFLFVPINPTNQSCPTFLPTRSSGSSRQKSILSPELGLPLLSEELLLCKAQHCFPKTAIAVPTQNPHA